MSRKEGIEGEERRWEVVRLASNTIIIFTMFGASYFVVKSIDIGRMVRERKTEPVVGSIQSFLNEREYQILEENSLLESLEANEDVEATTSQERIEATISKRYDINHYDGIREQA
ncbi:hypothetical protein V1477_003510 [Vespula maculifrons]|uniref:Uncharacterized protein n=1 Tax=Vespula maculifrons TaxID=7453 RepID=A0ABD2CUA4_VESMC